MSNSSFRYCWSVRHPLSWIECCGIYPQILWWLKYCDKGTLKSRSMFLTLKFAWISIYSYRVVLSMTIVGVFEQDYPVAKEVVNKMFETFVKEEIPDIEFKYTSIDIKDGLSESV
ncbi:uncharacterized protein NPIL_153211, partial [Nephila pilipes]